ncbi:MAG: GNAT family N-acetyltransferase [Nitrosopumilus sp.]|nr:GNAT family N-acetyltransferase [Nitrosopumilus sp.]MDH3488746.1 GNAT family N-acetyltransferase [Nitrosopumilus sp.]
MVMINHNNTQEVSRVNFPVTVLIRRTEDLDKIRDIRTIIFNKELGISQNNIFDNDDQKLEEFFIINHDSIIGTFRLRKENNSYKIERMGILSQYRSKGFGKIALQEIKTLSKKMGKSKIILDSIYDARNFYANSGFIQVGNVYSKVGIPHVNMYLDL